MLVEEKEVVYQELTDLFDSKCQLPSLREARTRKEVTFSFKKKVFNSILAWQWE